MFLTEVVNFDANVSIGRLDDVERQQLDLTLDMRVPELSTEQTFQAVDGVFHVRDLLVFGRDSQNAVFPGKCDV